MYKVIFLLLIGIECGSIDGNSLDVGLSDTIYVSGVDFGSISFSNTTLPRCTPGKQAVSKGITQPVGSTEMLSYNTVGSLYTLQAAALCPPSPPCPPFPPNPQYPEYPPYAPDAQFPPYPQAAPYPNYANYPGYPPQPPQPMYPTYPKYPSYGRAAAVNEVAATTSASQNQVNEAVLTTVFVKICPDETTGDDLHLSYITGQTISVTSSSTVAAVLTGAMRGFGYIGRLARKVNGAAVHA